MGLATKPHKYTKWPTELGGLDRQNCHKTEANLGCIDTGYWNRKNFNFKTKFVKYRNKKNLIFHEKGKQEK